MTGATRYHCHFELQFLLDQSDGRLTEILTGAPPVKIRTALICMKAAGKQFLVVGGCDNVGPDGRCGGHPTYRSR